MDIPRGARFARARTARRFGSRRDLFSERFVEEGLGNNVILLRNALHGRSRVECCIAD